MKPSVWVLIALLPAASTASIASDRLQSWMSDHAVAVRSIDAGNDTVPDLTKAFDAVLFMDRMAPATAIAKRPGPG